MVDQEVARDGDQPRAPARPPLIEATPGLQSPLERDLGQILGILAGAQPVAEEAVDVPHVLLIESGERFRTPVAHRGQ